MKFCLYFAVPWGWMGKGDLLPATVQTAPQASEVNTAAVRLHWECRALRGPGDKSALCKLLVPGFSRNYQAYGELPSCLTPSTSYRARTPLIKEVPQDMTTWWAEGDLSRPVWQAHNSSLGFVLTVGLKPNPCFPTCLEGKVLPSEDPWGSLEMEEFLQWGLRAQNHLLWPNGEGFSEKVVFELSMGGESTAEKGHAKDAESGKFTAHFRSSKWSRWHSRLGDKQRQSAFFVVRKNHYNKAGCMFGLLWWSSD